MHKLSVMVIASLALGLSGCSGGSSEDPAEDVMEDIAEDGLVDIDEDGSEDIIEDGLEDTTEDGSEDIIADGSDDITEDGSEDIIEDGLEDTTEDVSEEIIEDGSEDITEDGSEDIIEDGSDDITEDGSEDIIEEGSEDITEDGSEDIIEDGSDDITEDGSGEDTPAFDGTIPSLDGIYTDEQIESLELVGMTFNEGDQPPVIEGTFRIAPRIRQATSVPDDTVAANGFVSTEITFSNQNNESLTVDYFEDEDQGISDGSAVGSGSFISGEGQLFTVYLLTETLVDGFTADTTITISGRMTPSGIENVQQALFVQDNKGNDTLFIPNNTGRLFIDTDGLSQRLSDVTPLSEGSAPLNSRVGGFTTGN